MDDDAAERESAMAAFRERQRPPSTWVRPRAELPEPLAVMVGSVLAFAVLTFLLFRVVGDQDDTVSLVLSVLRSISMLVAVVAGVAAGVEWGIRRTRSDRADRP
jgi:hypothetical protein